MTLSLQQVQLITYIDQKVKIILANDGNEETILVELIDYMPSIKLLIDTVPIRDIEKYFYEYDGFYQYMKILETLAQKIADGVIKVPR